MMKLALPVKPCLGYNRVVQLVRWSITTTRRDQLSLRLRYKSTFLTTLLLGVTLLTKSLAVAPIPTINVASVDKTRFPNYTLNGSFMENALAKLTNSANFGPSGTVKRGLTITHTFGTAGSITAASLANYNILFVGMDETGNGLTASETQAIYTWSQQPGKVVIIAEQPVGHPLTTQYGFTVSDQISNPTTPTDADVTSDVKIFSGVFGKAGGVSQGGSSQGFFSNNCFTVQLAKNGNGNPTMLLETRQRDILVADIDYFTSLSGGVTGGGAISSDTDKAWANLWAWAVNEAINPGTSVSTGVASFTVAATSSSGCSSIKSGGTITFTSPVGTASNGQTYEYSIDGGAYYQSSPTFTNVADGRYDIYARASNTCSGASGTASGGTIQVNVVPIVGIDATPGLIINQGQSTRLTASGTTSYLWSTGATTVDISTAIAGVYSVTGTRGICSATASVTVVSGNVVNGPSCDNFVTKTMTDGLNSNFVSDVFAVTGPGSTTVYAATSEGPNISTDGGQTFTNSSIFWSNIYAKPGSNGTTLYFGTGNGLQISTDNGQTFTTRTTADGLGNDYITKVFAVDNSVYVGTYSGLSISTDNGQTFTNKTTANGLVDNFVRDVFAVGSTVYVITDNANNWAGATLHVSRDGGQTFTTLSSADGLGGNDVTRVYAIGNLVYVGTNGGLSISTNGGQTFTTRTAANGLAGYYIVDLKVVGNTIYAATDDGLGISTDGGKTFNNITTANGLGANRLSAVYVTGNSIYVASQGGGLSFCPPASVASLTLTASASLSTVCAGSVVQLSVVTSGGTAPYSYTWTAPDGITLSSTSTNTVSVTATATGVHTFTVTAADAGGLLTGTTTISITVDALPNVTIATTPELNIGPGQLVTLTASGATSYTWSTGQTTASISVSTADIYLVTGISGTCSATASVTVTSLPDLTLIIYTRPSTVRDLTTMSAVVDVMELKGISTVGAITVKISKDPLFSLTFNSSTTTVDNHSVQNKLWNFDANSDPGYYILTTTQSVPGGSQLSFGLTGTIVSTSTAGSATISSTLKAGSGGDIKVTNNTDADKIDYFQR